MTFLVYIMVASAFISADLISINIKIMELSLFKISVLIIFLLTVFNYLKRGRKLNLKPKNLQDIIIKFYLLWFFYAVISSIWVKDYYSWIRAVFFIGIGFISIWLLSVYMKKEKTIKHVFFVIYIMMVIHNILGWYELLTNNYLFADIIKLDKYRQFGYNSAARVPISMFGNINDYATALVIGIFVSYIVLSNSNKKILKVAGLCNIVSSIILLTRSHSRANMLGLIVGIFIFIFIKYFRRISIKSLAVIVFIPILFGFAFSKKIIEVFFKELQFDFYSDKGSDFIRLNLIKNGLLFLKNTVGFGTGAGNIEYWMENYKIYDVAHIVNMHNWWVEILTGYGIIIFALYIWIYIKMFRFLYFTYIKSGNAFIKNTSLGLICIMASFVISPISSSSNIATAWLWVFWGIVTAFIGYVERDSFE